MKETEKQDIFTEENERFIKELLNNGFFGKKENASFDYFVGFFDGIHASLEMLKFSRGRKNEMEKI